MFGLGWAEMLFVAVVALIVIGPQELPGLFRKMGQFMGQAKAMARDFTRAMNDAADQTGMGDVAKDLNALSNGLKSPTKAWSSYTPGSETEKLAQKRGQEGQALKDAAAARAQAAQAANAAAEDWQSAIAVGEEEADSAEFAALDEAAPKKRAAKKTAAKKPAAKKAPKKKADDKDSA